ncbi:MAG: DUF3090 family protein [Actinobacteria bacterium]|nr:DUF3090 family protein [Actinomycetota bacterium]
MTFYFEFDEAEAFATGAIGNPGERTFYLQVRAEGRTISVKCEKAQVAQMAEYLRGMLSDLPEPKQMPSIDIARLQGPVEQDFVLGTIGLGIDRSSMKMIVQLEEMPVIDFDDEDEDADIDEFMLDDDDDESTATNTTALAKDGPPALNTNDFSLGAVDATETITHGVTERSGLSLLGWRFTSSVTSPAAITRQEALNKSSP